MAYWHDKRALVTGGSAGLGLAIARELVRRGARVAIVGRDQRRLDDAVASLNLESSAEKPSQRDDAGEVVPAALGIRADVTQQTDVEAMSQQALLSLERLDLLVNCAGKSDRGTAASTTADRFQELWELNFLALVRCTQACLPHLLHTRGHVVHIGSLASKSAGPFLGAYPASKFPVAAYSQQLRLELSQQGLHVLLVCPGPIRRDDAGTRYADATGEMPASASQPGGGVRLEGIDPDQLARGILRACERRSPELIVPGRAKLLLALAQLWPSLGDWIVQKMTG